MKCIACSEEGLLAEVTITKFAPLADRKGTIKIGGLKLGQMDAKEAWDSIETPEGLIDKPVRGPILCPTCGAEHYYITAGKGGLQLGRMQDVDLKALEVES